MYSLRSALKLISKSLSLNFLKKICSGLIPKKTSLFFKFDLANRVERYQEEARDFLKKTITV